jgi:DNA-binding beta-propeller fold protein YncE
MRYRSCVVLLLSLIATNRLAAGEITTVAGTGTEKANANQGLATEVNVGQPFGVEIGPEGALYITEVGNHRVMRVDRELGKLTTVAGTGSRGYTGDGGPATEAHLNEPYEVRFDSAGNMYFVDMMPHVIRRVDAKTGVISTIGGTGKLGYSGDGGPATAAMFNRPHSIALDQARQQLYVADIGNHRIRRIDLRSGKVESIAGTSAKQLPSDGQLARDTPVLGPRALYLAGDRLWVALREGHSIWYIDLKTGRWNHVAGTGKKGFTGDGGPPLQATFNGPKGIALGPAGHVYVVDTENHAIRKIDLEQNRISTIAGRGPQHGGGRGDGGSATAAELARPHGIAVDSAGNVYIGDTNNHRVRRVVAEFPKNSAR